MANTRYFKPKTRIKKVLDFYMGRGTNKESVNKVYRKILKQESI